MIYLPAIAQTSPAPSMSSRYVHVNTSDIIDVMVNEGFSVVDQKVDNVRKSDPSFARHAVILRSEALGVSDGTYVPQAILMNSHNGKSKVSLRLGMYRFVCANGLVVGDDMFQTSIKHTGDLARQVIDKIKEMSKQSQKVFQKIDTWSKIDLSKEQRLDFAIEALELRFGKEKSKQYDPYLFLDARREEDDKGNLWSTFNIIQENTVKGGIVGKNANNRNVRSKALKSISLDIDYNEKLWKLAESYV